MTSIVARTTFPRRGLPPSPQPDRSRLPRGATLVQLACLIPLLAGCATNALTIDRANALGTAGGRATAGVRALLTETDAANRQSAIDVATLDPACTLPSPLIASASAAAPPAFICRVGPAQPGDFTLHRLTATDFRPALTVIEALTDYLGAVDAIAGARPADAGAIFADAAAKLTQASGDLATIAGATAPNLLTGEQTAAVKGALTLLGTLADEQDRVHRLRALESPAQRARFRETTAALRAVGRRWIALLTTEIDAQAKVADLQVQLAGRMPAGMRDLRTRQMDAIDRRAATARLGATLEKAVDVLDQSHDAYLDLLTDPGARLTAEERRRRARLIETRLLAALDGLAMLVRAF